MKYQVTYYFHTCALVEVDADNIDAAKEKGRELITNEELLQSLEEDNDPDIIELENN